MSDDLGGHNRQSEAETAGAVGANEPRDDPTVTLDASSVRAEIGLSAGEVVGPFRLLEVIGVGGFGVVWLAEQREPIRRRVALKVIKPGMDSAAVVARFEAERNALSVMDHPNIARVLDGGTTGRGLPYFVMEHVPGEPLTDYCRRRKLGLNARLEVFGQVCQAVQHAHTKGVVHRDLKPSNILVREVDNAPVAKVIDFGVAKALDQRLSEHTVFTARGHMLGTPEYMAPEQAEASGRDIDTRADVYSLGVVLYELLTGARPFDFRELAYHEVGRVLAEVEPPRPSTRVIAALAETGDTDAKSVGETRLIARALKNDLDWVVMKALEKDRGRRYQAASALGDDVRRVLASEPVEASPPSISYRFTRFVRRHRVPIAASAAVAVLVGASAVVSAVGWARALENERAARETLTGIVREALAEDWAGAELMGYAEAAGIEIQLSEEGDDRRFVIEFEGGDEVPRLAAFAEQLFAWSSESAAAAALTAEQQSQLRAFVFDEIVEAARPGRLGPEATVIDAVLAAVPKLDGYELDAEADAGLRAELANVLFRAGSDVEARDLAEQADRRYSTAGMADPVVLFNRLTFAAAASRAGDQDAATDIYTALVPEVEARFGATHPFTLSVLSSRAVNDARRGDFQRAAEVQDTLAERFRVVEGIGSRGEISARASALYARAELNGYGDGWDDETGRASTHALLIDEADALLALCLEKGIDDELLFTVASTYVRLLADAGRYVEADRAGQEWLGRARGVLGTQSSVVAAIWFHQARSECAMAFAIPKTIEVVGVGEDDEMRLRRLRHRRVLAGLFPMRISLDRLRDRRVGRENPGRQETIVHAKFVDIVMNLYADDPEDDFVERLDWGFGEVARFAELDVLDGLSQFDPARPYIARVHDRARAMKLPGN